MKINVEIQCPYCDKYHVHPVEVSIPKPKETVEEKHNGNEDENPDVV